MPFFKDIDTMDIFEDHASKLEGLEMSQARKVLKQYKIAREKLKAQLQMANPGSFTEANMKSALAQIELGIREMRMNINPSAKEGFRYLTEQGAEDSAKEVNALEKRFHGVRSALPVDAIIESVEPDNFLFNNFESSIDAYSENMRSQFQNSLTQALLQKQSWSQAVFGMEQVFNLEEWKLARIVRTELHGIYNVAKSNGFLQIRQDYIPELQKTLYHPMDSRTGDDSKEAALKRLIVPVDEPFEYEYKGKLRRFMTPPDRPNDRAILIPYRNSYGEA